MNGTRLGLLCVVICLVAVGAASGQDKGRRPWDPTYKIRPDEEDRLTAADVVGPDGIVYPDWRYAGVPGGIPDVPEKAKVADFGAKPDDDNDDYDAIVAAVEAVAKKGGGAIVLGEGTWHLDRPVLITHDNIVIRGQGPKKTKVVFRYGVPKRQILFFHPKPGATLGYGEWIDVHASPDKLKLIRLESGGDVLGERKRRAHWGGRYRLMVTTWKLVKKLGPGEHALKAVAGWTDGKTAEATLKITIDPDRSVPRGRRRRPYGGLGAFTFCGDLYSGERTKLTKDGVRGDTRIELASTKDLEPGDALFVRAPATKRWNRLVRNRCRWGSYRDYQFRVEKVEGKTVHLNQPLRYDFPTADGSWARELVPIRRCGVEDLAIVQTRKLWTNGIICHGGWECWVRGVRIEKAGRFPVYHTNSKWCEVRDCTFVDAMYHGGGGTAYVGWQHAWDCLMDNVTTRKMRHAPCVQWATSGCVIRNSTFHGSDMQWHAGWTNENLFENCVVDAHGRWGTYGYGAWASPPEDRAHGPNGPRNVVYRCDIRSPKTGLWMGGMNENWLVLHNRFIVDRGPGIFAKTASFDHIIKGNVLALRDRKAPMIELRTADCVGVELLGNKVFGGSGTLVGGKGRPAAEKNNTFAPYKKNPPRPAPEVKSIFEWQRREGEGIR
ncbi:MAG: right-handed parallel beta-helix repeat-containing protein [Planctomycetota bacterium]